MSVARWREDGISGDDLRPFAVRLTARCYLGTRRRANDYCRGLFILDVRRFDDRPPLFYFRLVVGGEPFRGLLPARWDFLALLGISRLHCGIGKRIDDRRIELADDVFG